MENLVFTQLSISEVRKLFREELEIYFATHKQSHTSGNEADTLFSVQEAANFLNLSVPTIYGYVQRQEIPVNKRSKRLYFSKKELTAWIKDGRKKTVLEIEAEASFLLQSNKKGGRNV